MMMQMPVVLLIKAMRPVSLFRTMLTDATGTGAATVGTVGHYWSIGVLLLLLLLEMEVMLLLVMGMRQPTATGHTQLLLLVTAGGKVLLTVDTPWH